MSLMEEIKNKQKSVGDLVKYNQTASFVSYRQGNLLYKTSDGFEFPIEASDLGEAEVQNTCKAIELMRYIRKQVAIIQQEP